MDKNKKKTISNALWHQRGQHGSQAHGAQASAFFPCESWLDAAHGTQRVLAPLWGDPRKATVAYIMTLHTGKRDGAGTSARVAVTVHGGDRSSGPHPVEGPPGLEKPLQAGQVAAHLRMPFVCLISGREGLASKPLVGHLSSVLSPGGTQHLATSITE